MQDSVTKFVNDNKEVFTDRLTEQVANLSSKLDPGEREKLRDLSVAQVVEAVSQQVIDVIGEQNSALVDQAMVSSRVLCYASHLVTMLTRLDIGFP